MKLLITAFGAFPGMPSNPSERVVAGLAKRHGRRLKRLGIDLVTAVLPVVYAQVERTLAELIAAHRPDAMILVGVAGRRKVLSIETRAVNRIGTLRTDAARQRSAQSLVQVRGPGTRTARWPAARLAASMRLRGTPTATSLDAGDYLCNQALYIALATTGLPAGFLHIPRPRGRRPHTAKLRRLRPTIDQMIVGLTEASVIMGRESRRRT